MLFLLGYDESCSKHIWEHYHSSNGFLHNFWAGPVNTYGYYSTYSLMSQGSTGGRRPERPTWLKDVSLLTSFERFRFHSCSDDRDRAFAILLILPNSERRALARYFPDYSLSLQKFWLIVFAHLFLWHGRSEYLYAPLRVQFAKEAGGLSRAVRLAEMEDVEAALLPLLHRVNDAAKQRPPCNRWRKRSEDCVNEERTYETSFVDELCAQEEMLHRIIADFEG